MLFLLINMKNFFKFKIIDETTLKFDVKDLYITLAQDSTTGRTKYGVEVTTRTRGFGRRYTPSKAVAQEVFDYLSRRLSRFQDYTSAKEFTTRVFSCEKMFQLLFLVRSEGRTLSQVQIGELRRNMDFDIVPKYNKAGRKYKRGALTLQVISDGQKIGNFIGTRFGKDFTFSLSVSAI